MTKNISAILIAGPTASGKSAAALKLAAMRNGEIVNADAMQVYADLRVLTARPSPQEERQEPHHLYGVIDGAQACSAGIWAEMASRASDEIQARGKLPIFVGGTGLYMKVLEEGLSPIPDVPASIRHAAAARREALGASAFQAEVISRDPAMSRLPEGDRQRLLRAWEVFEATGRALSAWQSEPRQPVLHGPLERWLILPERDALYDRCNQRFDQMLEQGALEEVRGLRNKKLDPTLPLMKSLGVPELSAHLSGLVALEDARERAKQNTRRFAKRQLTWFKNQTPDWDIWKG